MGAFRVVPEALAAAAPPVAGAAAVAGEVSARVRGADAACSGVPVLQQATRAFADVTAGRLTGSARDLDELALDLGGAAWAYAAAERSAAGRSLTGGPTP